MRSGRLADFGFRVVIASSFADIFANNSLKNGLLTVRLEEEQVREIMRKAASVEGYRLTVDLERLVVEDDSGFAASFTVDEFARHCLMNGLDDIGLTLQHEPEISAYEARHPVRAEMAGIAARLDYLFIGGCCSLADSFVRFLLPAWYLLAYVIDVLPSFKSLNSRTRWQSTCGCVRCCSCGHLSVSHSVNFTRQYGDVTMTFARIDNAR